MELFVTTVRVHSTRVFALNVTVTFFFFTLQTNQNNFHFEKNFCTYFVSLQTLLRNLIYFATLMRRGVLEHCWCLEGMWIIGDTKNDVKLTLLVVIILCTLIVHVHCTADVQGRWMLNNTPLISEDNRLFVISSVTSMILLKQENSSGKKSHAWIGL